MKHEFKIIPKEEVLANRSNAYEFIDFDKQETIEEVAEKWNEKQTTLEFGKPYNAPNRIKAFIEGAKWQQERMYSKEDLEVAYFEGKEGLYSFNDWFEQFKKK